MTAQQPEALAQECADYATSLRSTVNLVHLTGREKPQSMIRAADIFERASADIRRLHARVQELEAKEVERAESRLKITNLNENLVKYGARLRYHLDQVIASTDSIPAAQAFIAKRLPEAVEEAESALLGNANRAEQRVQELEAELAEETEATNNWRRLALQFDGHRMQALGYLKALLKGEKELETGARGFLASPPLDGERVLAERIAALAATTKAAPVKLPEPDLHIDSDLDADAPYKAYSVSLFESTVRGLLALQCGLKSPACHCEACDIAANGGLRSRMSLCPQCGDKRCPRAAHHNNQCAKTGATN